MSQSRYHPWVAVVMVLLLCCFAVGQSASSSRDDLSLVGGHNPWTGYVAVEYRGRRGWVCDEGFTAGSADVICRQLGYRHASAFYSNTRAGTLKARDFLTQPQYPREPVLTSLTCKGHESAWSECPFAEVNQTRCRSSQSTVMVICQNSVRLVNGARSSQGLVQVFHDGYWRDVCAHYWDKSDANAVCRHVGFHGAILPSESDDPRLRSTGGPVLQRYFACPDYETSLLNCPMRNDSTLSSGCSTASVQCGLIRLAHGTVRSGAVQVHDGRRWGYVCYDSDWTAPDASSVCKGLGYADYQSLSVQGPYFGAVLIHQPRCPRPRKFLFDCDYQYGSDLNCSTRNAAGVICRENCTYDRPIPNSNSSEMPLQTIHSGESITVRCAAGYLPSHRALACWNGHFTPNPNPNPNPKRRAITVECKPIGCGSRYDGAVWKAEGYTDSIITKYCPVGFTTTKYRCGLQTGLPVTQPKCQGVSGCVNITGFDCASESRCINTRDSFQCVCSSVDPVKLSYCVKDLLEANRYLSTEPLGTDLPEANDRIVAASELTPFIVVVVVLGVLLVVSMIYSTIAWRKLRGVSRLSQPPPIDSHQPGQSDTELSILQSKASTCASSGPSGCASTPAATSKTSNNYSPPPQPMMSSAEEEYESYGPTGRMDDVEEEVEQGHYKRPRDSQPRHNTSPSHRPSRLPKPKRPPTCIQPPPPPPPSETPPNYIDEPVYLNY